MGLKSFIPGTAARARKGHIKYLRKKARGYDVLLLVEWDDNKLTEMPANLDPQKDGWFEAANGLYFVPAGEGVDPVSYHGVDVVRVHASIACPISTTAALQAELENDGDYKVRTNGSGQTKEVIKYKDPGKTNGHGPTVETPDGPGAEGDNGVAADGGVDVNEGKRYNLRPPSPAVGFAFGLDEVKQRAPNAISGDMIRRAVEYGKESERADVGGPLRYFLLGLGVAIGLVVLLGILGAVVLNLTGGGGGGSSGGGGGENLGLLLLAAGPPARAMLEEKVDSLTTDSED